jgi:hypothetical protein
LDAHLHSECGQLEKILQRPNYRGVCRYLEGESLPGILDRGSDGERTAHGISCGIDK